MLISLLCFVVFEPYKDNKVDLLLPKLVFVALNLVGLGLGVWKVGSLISVEVILNLLLRIMKHYKSLPILIYCWQLNTLGLLPTHVSDWVSSLPPAQV